MGESVRSRDLSNKRFKSTIQSIVPNIRFNSGTRIQPVSYPTLTAINYQMSSSNLIPTLVSYPTKKNKK